MAIKVMVNGLPGNMAREIIEAVQRRGLEVVPFSLTGPGVDLESMEVGGETIAIVSPETRDEKIKEIKAAHGEFYTIDFTHPTAVNSNAEFYIANDLPFIMGTTGGDREKLMNDVKASGLYSVIAANMAKQIVALQAMLENMRVSFPDIYKDYTLTVVESHQKTKADTSGTAKAIVETLNGMGIKPFSVDDIELVRVEHEQMERMEVPEEYLTGHAFHTYRLVSPDGTMAFEYRHNLCGRTTYAEGSVDAVQFLATQKEAGSEKTLFNMIDILQSGGMN